MAYIPGEHIVSLSKLARIVKHFARTLQVQERLTKQVAELVENDLAPKGVGVILEAEHQCMAIRGVQAAGTKTVTSTMYGLLRDNLGIGRSSFRFAELAVLKPAGVPLIVGLSIDLPG